jgi:hypothetical protein
MIVGSPVRWLSFHNKNIKMAVNINTVYQTVLAIANKEQRGYITPQEFNLFANQAQMETFEQYFYDINQFSRLPGNDTEYSDMLNVLNEKITTFQELQNVSLETFDEPGYLFTYGAQAVIDGVFDEGITNWSDVNSSGTASYDTSSNPAIRLTNNANGGSYQVSQSVTTVASTLYEYTADIDATHLNDSGNNATAEAFISFKGKPSNKIPAGYSGTVSGYVDATGVGTVLKLRITALGNTNDYAKFDNVSVKPVSSRKLSLDSAGSIYRLGTLIYENNGTLVEVDKILPNEALYIVSSPLTKPTASRPAYVQNSESTITIYPSNLTTGYISCNYIRKPKSCNWAYSTINNNQPLYDSANSVDFELHASEEVTLVNKILELAGISMQKPDLQQSGMGKDQKEITQQKS